MLTHVAQSLLEKYIGLASDLPSGGSLQGVEIRGDVLIVANLEDLFKVFS